MCDDMEVARMYGHSIFVSHIYSPKAILLAVELLEYLVFRFLLFPWSIFMYAYSIKTDKDELKYHHNMRFS